MTENGKQTKNKHILQQHKLTILVAMVGTFVSILLWQALTAQEQVQIGRIIQTETNNAGINIEKLIEPRIQALRRMTKRWELRNGIPRNEWEHDARQYMLDQPGYQAIEWVDSDFTVQWIIPLKGNEAAQGLDLAAEERRRKALIAARDQRQITVSRPVDLVQGGKGFLVYSPLFPNDQFDGFILGVFRIEDTLSPLLSNKNFEHNYSFAIYEGGEEIYGHPIPDRRHQAEWSRETTVEVGGIVWRLQVWPRPALLAEVQSNLPNVVLAVGFVVTALSTLTLYLRQTLVLRTREVESTNRELVREVTERKEIETELNTYHEHLEALVQKRTAELEAAVTEISQARDNIDAILRAVADGLIVTDLDHKVIQVNPAAEALLGLQPEKMVGQHIASRTPNNHLQQVVYNAINQGTNGLEVDVEFQTSDDTQKKILRTRTALVDDRQGQPLGAVTIIQDVTRLREVDQLKTELLTTAAHELRTPLTTILGFSEILTTRELDQARQERYIRMIRKQAGHLTAIVEDLLNIARLEAKRALNLKLEPTNMADLMEEVALPFSETDSDHKIKLDWLESMPWVCGDHLRLAQVGRNLLSNAIKYSPKGGVITISGWKTADRLVISIRDEGIGMSPEQQKFLFQPFYRADTSNLTVDGFGLGLAISKMIIENHSGEIWLESQRGIGTTAYFSLPLPAQDLLIPAP